MIYPFLLAGIVPSTRDIDNPMLYVAMANVFGISLLAATLYLKKRMFFRIYYNEKTQMFTGIRYTWRLAIDRVVFAAGSVRETGVPPGLSELRGNYVINGRPYYISVKDFKTPVYYNIMMGYIKPDEK